MASWTMAGRVACVSTLVMGRNAVVKGRRARVSVCLPRRLCFLSQKAGLVSACRSFCSSVSASSISSASAEGGSGFRRPEEMEWKKELANSVSLIGSIHRSVDIKYLDSGKIVATCSIRVDRPSSSQTSDKTTLFAVQFWDELAEIAAAHLKKEDRVFIAGSVWVENYLGNDNLQKTICKVVARDLKFVGANYRKEQGENAGFEESGKKLSTEEQWKDYFDDPQKYWDNRNDKLNLKSPDFKHKSTGAALWIDSKGTPSWVKERLEQGGDNLDTGSAQDQRSKAAVESEKLWQAFFANPSDWWDNRVSKKNPKYPDFKNKSTGEALWIESYVSPSWVKSQLSALDAKAKAMKEGSSSSKERNPKTSFEEEDLSFF